MAAVLSSPPMLPSAKPRIHRPHRPIAASLRVPAAPQPGDAKRPWWAPLFRMIPREIPVAEEPAASDAGEEAASGRSRLTAEKARVLRREMRATETWHDAMYHSAIASRLASPDRK